MRRLFTCCLRCASSSKFHATLQFLRAQGLQHVRRDGGLQTLVGAEIAYDLLVLDEHRRLGRVLVKWRVLIVATSKSSIFVPDTVAVVGASILAIFIEDRFRLGAICHFAQVCIVVILRNELGSANDVAYALGPCAQANCESQQKREKHCSFRHLTVPELIRIATVTTSRPEGDLCESVKRQIGGEQLPLSHDQSPRARP